MSTTLANGKPTIVTSEILDRQPPSDLAAEKGVLGSILLKPEICGDVFSLVGPDDFYDEANQKLFAHMQGIRDSGAKPDLTLLVNRLNLSGDYENIGGAGYLAEISKSVPHAGNVKHYAGIVRELGAKRQIILATGELMRGAYNGRAADELLDSADQSFADIRARANLADTHAKPIGIATLISDHPQLGEPIIDGILRRGETGNIIADPKRGKSWLAYGLVLSIAAGDNWLKRFGCRRGRVLLIDNELHPATLADRIPTTADAMAIQRDEYAERVDVLSLRGRLADLNGIGRILEAVNPGTYDLIVLDAFYRALPNGVSENDNAAMAMLFNKIDQITARLGCAWINIHHAAKGDQSQKSVTDMGAGAGSQSRAADAHIVLRPHDTEGAVVLEAVVRSFPPVVPLVLRWEFPVWRCDDVLDPKLIRGRMTKQEERQGDRDKDGIDKLLSALASGPATFSELTRTVIPSKDRCKRLLNILETTKRVTATPIVKQGNKCQQYRLTEQSADVVAGRGSEVAHSLTT